MNQFSGPYDIIRMGETRHFIFEVQVDRDEY